MQQNRTDRNHQQGRPPEPGDPPPGSSPANRRAGQPGAEPRSPPAVARSIGSSSTTRLRRCRLGPPAGRRPRRRPRRRRPGKDRRAGAVPAATPARGPRGGARAARRAWRRRRGAAACGSVAVALVLAADQTLRANVSRRAPFPGRACTWRGPVERAGAAGATSQPRRRPGARVWSRAAYRRRVRALQRRHRCPVVAVLGVVVVLDDQSRGGLTVEDGAAALRARARRQSGTGAAG